jgi:hypothetical protein
VPALDGRVDRLRGTARRTRQVIISPASPLALGYGVKNHTNLGSVAYPAANKALFYPFRCEEPTKLNIAWMESVGNGNGVHVDVGVYDSTYTKIQTLGSTNWTNATGIQDFTTWTALTLGPGRYYAAIAMDSTSGGVKIFKDGSGNGSLFRMMGCVAKTTAFALPSGTVAPATYGDDALPIFGFTGETVL